MADKVVTPEPKDQDSDKDGCDIKIEDFTADDELPAAEGGVA